jgi:3-methyladenine DNA glycosylase/8-oxoguanine DNA glycosylase
VTIPTVPTRTEPLAAPLDLRSVLGPLVRGWGDPTIQLNAVSAVRACLTADGPATLLVDVRNASATVLAEAWGRGAELALEGLPGLLGLDDDATGFDPGHHPLVASLARRRPRLPIGRTGRVLEVLVPAILEQKVTGREAWRAYRGLVRVHGEPAPGPVAQRFRLRVPPAPEVIAALPYHAFHPLGVEQRRAEVVRRVAADAQRLEALATLPGSAAERGAAAGEALRRYPGIGPWTAAEVAQRAWGDPDAVSVGDFHLPHLVSWALAGEPRATDARMLELLEPWRGHRARVVKLLEGAGLGAPRYGPRLAPRDIRAI